MIIRSEPEFYDLLSKIEKVDAWSVDTEGVKKIYPDWKLTGVSISLDGKNGYYIPVGHLEGSGQLSAEFVVSKLKPFFEDKGKVMYMANSKYDMQVFRLIDPTIEFAVENAFCTLTASFLFNVDNRHSLEECAFREFGHKMQTLDSIGCPKKKDPSTKDQIYFTDQMSIKDLAPYAIDDALQTYRLGVLYSANIPSQGYSKVYYELEMPFMFVLMKMEEKGVILVRETLHEHLEEAPEKLKKLNEEIQEMLPVDYYVNVSSNQQMNEVLFGVMKINPRGNPGKSGTYKVSNEYLDLWSIDHPVCGLIANYRRVVRLFGNYLNNLYYRMGPDGRIRSSFKRHGAATGRLSSSKPNLQNIPRAENDIYGLRKLFKAQEGRSLVVADYSQIELRVVAHLSKDPAMIDAFRRGEDVHSITAKNIYKLKCEPSEVKDKFPIERQIAKSINFGIIYEAGPNTLAATANKGIPDSKNWVTEEDMKEAIEKWFKTYPMVKRHIEVCHQKAIKHGHIKTITGRTRPIPDAQIKPKTDDDHRKRYGAFRKSSNTPVQGSAADIIAIAMRNIDRRFQEMDLSSYPLQMQVHDELMFEFDEDVAEEYAKIIKEEMESAVKLRVPLVADVKVGKIWGDMK